MAGISSGEYVQPLAERFYCSYFEAAALEAEGKRAVPAVGPFPFRPPLDCWPAACRMTRDAPLQRLEDACATSGHTRFVACVA